MKTIAKTIIIMLATTALLSLHSGITAKAEEVEKPYSYGFNVTTYVNYPSRYGNATSKYIGTFSSTHPACFIVYDLSSSSEPKTQYEISFYLGDGKIGNSGVTSSGLLRSISEYENEEHDDTDTSETRAFNSWLTSTYNNYSGSMSTNIPCFSSKEAALDYFVNNDDSGMLNKSDVIPSIDWSVEHDFNGDYYSSDIPAPQLTNLSHNGFNVFNIGDYYIDIICESYYYGAKFENLGFVKGGWVVKPDYEWIYNKHYYNFTRSDIAVNRTTINLSELYGVDNSAALLDDMKKWGSEYPECENLPTYAFGRATSGNSTAYRMAFVYNHMSNTDDLKKLQYSQCAKTVYYVRFYTKDMKYSKWVKYSVSKGTGNADTIGEAFEKWEENNGYIGDYSKVEYEEIQYDDTNQTIVTTPDNKPISTNTVIGSQNNNTGVTDYSTSIDFEDMNMSNFKDAVGGMVDSIKDFPTFISRLFGFLPSWVLTMIAIAIGAVVLLRFLGR